MENVFSLAYQAEPPGADHDTREQITQYGAKTQALRNGYCNNRRKQVYEGIEQHAVIFHMNPFELALCASRTIVLEQLTITQGVRVDLVMRQTVSTV